MQTLVFSNYRLVSFVSSPKSSLVVPLLKTNEISLKKCSKLLFNLRKNCNISSYVAPTIISCAQNNVVVTHQDQVDGNKDEEKYEEVGLKQGESMIPKHVAISLDGNRRWLKHHGLDLDYRPFFHANMRFAEYCLKWGVSAGTGYIYGLGNMKHRTKEANDLIIGQFEQFLDDGLDKFIRNGVKVSIVGELSMLPESCQATIKKVEAATKNNTRLDLMLPMCYTSQRDIVDATKRICKKVRDGAMEFEDIDEDMFEQHLSMCGSRPPLDLFIRTGGQMRIGMLLGWQVPHAELFFTETSAPDFDEQVFLDALRSFQQRGRWFGK